MDEKLPPQCTNLVGTPVVYLLVCQSIDEAENNGVFECMHVDSVFCCLSQGHQDNFTLLIIGIVVDLSINI